ncbi:MAG TPA: hypothetical protein VMH39_02150, partial [Gemmatimonadaceae bacterium]|nr:hypothetical protein [Gemmatimonadaceae bacterium]
YTETVLKGNVPGVLTDGGVGTSFTPGPWAVPNELINAYGELPGTNAIEAKGWINVKMPHGFTGGATVTHDLGERATAYFMIDASKYFFITGDNQVIYANQLQGVNGQTIFLEPRGNHFYGDRTIVDLHLDRHFILHRSDWVVTGDLFNALAANTITEVKTLVDGVARNVGGGYNTYSFGSPLLRVPPITLRIGARVALGTSSP